MNNIRECWNHNGPPTAGWNAELEHGLSLSYIVVLLCKLEDLN